MNTETPCGLKGRDRITSLCPNPCHASWFTWCSAQKTVAAFSVSQSDAEKVVAYIFNQEKNHQKTTFQEEYRGLLERYRVAYDERYVWD